jgi:predicted patatin/cPLA2 family phospholipase
MRSLILAGGGIKVAFQAGVMQVWLDEAELSFDHVDAASGGVFNLAMMCQGLSGSAIADNWRHTNPRSGIDVNAAELAKLLYAESLFTLDNYRNHVFRDWGLDWQKIRSSPLNATFNVFNFSKKELQVIDAKNMTEDLLVACVSLPMWFPPVRIKGEIYIDSVFLSDANVEEAIRRGADELWVIWTVSEKNEWYSGFVATYFQIIETSANGHYRAVLKRIEENNRRISAGNLGEFGRHIEVKELRAEVPLHYLIDFSQDRMIESVNLGVQRAREWCNELGIALKKAAPAASVPPESKSSLKFTEEMKGYLTIGGSEFTAGYEEGKKSRTYAMFHLTIDVDDVDRFVTAPEHDAAADGYFECQALGGRMEAHGRFNLFVDEKDPARKKMLYRLFFQTPDGKRRTLSGFKDIADDPGVDIWRDTTTLYTRILDGHVDAAAEETAPILASGLLIIQVFDFMKQLTTFRTEGSDLSARNLARVRFMRLFAGKLLDVYTRELLTTGPI